MPTDAFDRYVTEQMARPGFAKAFEAARTEIETIDQLVRALDTQRTSKGLTKAQLARSAGMEPAALRRLFTSEDPNPTFATIATLLAHLDLGIVIVPKAKRASAHRARSRASSSPSRAQARKPAHPAKRRRS